MAGLLDPVDAGENVLQISTPNVEKIRLLEFSSVSSRAAIVRRKDHVSLIGGVLHEAVEGIHRLRGGAAMDVNDGGVLSVARHVVGDVEKCGDGPLAVAAGIVHEIRLDHVFGANAGDERMRDLMRLAGGECVHPEIAGGSGPVVIIKQTRAVFGEGRVASSRLVYAFRDGQGG